MQVEIWSDVVCPWCAIGKRRLEGALARFEQAEEVTVRWRSFELDPSAPQERTGPYAELLAAKYGASVADAQAMIDRMTENAAAEGLRFRFDLARPGNTFDAHRLLHLAADRGVQDAVKERLLRGYLEEGEAIGSADTLVRLAADAGLDPDEASGVLAGDAYAEEVRADERQAAAFGISGVPFFVIDRRYGVSGAQPSAVILQALERAWAERTPIAVVGSAAPDDGCADGSCAV